MATKEKLSATEMLEKQLAMEADPAWDQKRPIFIPRSSTKDTHVVVGVNGKFYQVQKGMWVDVPLPVYEVLQNSMDADALALQAREKIMI